MQYRLSEIITRLGGILIGEDKITDGIAPTHIACATEITFLTDDKYKKDISQCQAGSIILSQQSSDDLPELQMSRIITDNPYLYFSKLSQLFHPKKLLNAGIAGSAIVAPTATIGINCAIASGVVIGDSSKLGDNCQIYPNVVIGDNVIIGNNVTLYPNITIYSNVTIGDYCEFHSGVIIGSDGFGYAPDKQKVYHKIPQIGGVIIGNKVEIGANSTVDAGTFEATVIEDGVIIDNLVQVAHNVKIGAHTAIAACSAIAGSATIGKYCTLAGGSAVTGHVSICDYTVIGGLTGISKSITKPDLYMAAYPFSNYKDYAKNAVHIRKLNEMHQKIKNLEIQIKLLLGGENVIN